MSAHLSTALASIVAEESESAARRAAGPEAEASHLVRLARRRRTIRASLAAGSAALVLALGAGTVYGLTRPEPAPPATLAPTPTPASTPEPTYSPVPFDPDPDDGVTVHPLLPSAMPLEPGLLAGAGPGWSLVVYQGTCDYPCGYPTSPEVLYLVGPAGERYEVPVEGLGSIDLVDWRQGSPHALFSRWSEAYTQEYFVIDLESGEMVGGPVRIDEGYGTQRWLGTADDIYLVLPPEPGQEDQRSQLARISYAGRVLARAYVARNPELIWSPDRNYVLETGSSGPVVLELPGLEPVPINSPPPSSLLPSGAYVGTCDGIGWGGTDQILLSCEEIGEGQEGSTYVMHGGVVWSVPLSGAARRIGVFEPQAFQTSIRRVWPVGGRVLASVRWTGYSEHVEPSFVEVTGDGRFVPLELRPHDLTIHGTWSDRLVASVTSSGGRSQSLVLMDPFTGATTVLLAPVSETRGLHLEVVTISDQE